MKSPSGEDREILLNKLRAAVAFQIALWDAATEISEALDCELPEVLNFVQAAAITADDGTDLSHGDLDELLGISPPGRTATGKRLGNSVREIH